MKILVTGAKGFVGKNLCWALKNLQAVNPAFLSQPSSFSHLYFRYFRNFCGT